MNLVQIDSALKEIAKHRNLSVTHFKTGLEHRVRCGELLMKLKAIIPAGDWEKTLAKISLPKTTAWRYICTFQDWDPKLKRLRSGANLVHSLRSDELVNEVEVGQYRPEVYQERKLNEQLELDFSYEEFVPHLRSLTKARNVEELSATTLQRLKAELAEAQKRIEAVLAEKGAINLENHQP